MRNRFCLAIWALLSVVPLSLVQGGAPVFHFDSLRYPLVQKELQLSRLQVIEINLRLKSYDDAILRALREGSLPELKNVTEWERTRLMQQSSKEASLRNWKIMEQFAPRFDTLLDARQRRRLYEIDWQVGWKTSGGRVLADAELGELIGLSKEQQTQLKAIDDGFKDKEAHLIYSDGAQRGSPELPKVIAAMKRLYPDWDKAMARILTPQQKDKLEALLGKPIDVRQLLKEMKQRQEDISR